MTFNSPDVIRACIDRPHRLPPGVESMAALGSQLWEPGRTLRISFAGGYKRQRVSVLQAAAVWAAVGNIRVVETTGPAELRCAFVPGGSWSHVGTQCLLVPPDEPTMNMGWLDDFGRDLHELGHAFGLVHEHQAADIDWNKPACYAFYGAPPNNWTRRDVQTQVFQRYSAGSLRRTNWDGKGIMEYPIQRQLVLSDRFVCGINPQLSAIDRQYFPTLYPF